MSEKNSISFGFYCTQTPTCAGELHGDAAGGPDADDPLAKVQGLGEAIPEGAAG